MSDNEFVRNRPPSYGEFAERPFPGSPDDMMDTIAALRARVAKLEAAAVDVAVSLAAAISLLERGGKKAAPSDKMFEQMLVDYRNSLERARAALSETAT